MEVECHDLCALALSVLMVGCTRFGGWSDAITITKCGCIGGGDVVVWYKQQVTLVITTTTPCVLHGCCGVNVVFGV